MPIESNYGKLLSGPDITSDVGAFTCKCGYSFEDSLGCTRAVTVLIGRRSNGGRVREGVLGCTINRVRERDYGGCSSTSLRTSSPSAKGSLESSRTSVYSGVVLSLSFLVF